MRRNLIYEMFGESVSASMVQADQRTARGDSMLRFTGLSSSGKIKPVSVSNWSEEMNLPAPTLLDEDRLEVGDMPGSQAIWTIAAPPEMRRVGNDEKVCLHFYESNKVHSLDDPDLIHCADSLGTDFDDWVGIQLRICCTMENGRPQLAVRRWNSAQASPDGEELDGAGGVEVPYQSPSSPLEPTGLNVEPLPSERRPLQPYPDPPGNAHSNTVALDETQTTAPAESDVEPPLRSLSPAPGPSGNAQRHW